MSFDTKRLLLSFCDCATTPLKRSGVLGSRQTASGLGSIVSRIGGLVSPLFNMLAAYHPSIPTIIFGSLSIISGSLSFRLPETRRRELPESIDEAENGYVDRERDLLPMYVGE